MLTNNEGQQVLVPLQQPGSADGKQPTGQVTAKKKYRLAVQPVAPQQAEEEIQAIGEDDENKDGKEAAGQQAPAIPENRDLTRKVLNYLSAKVPR